jgi:CheY-like chemotaxis protein
MNKTILVIKDQAGLLTTLHSTLVQKGLSATLANNGPEGLKLALSAHPDLILLDFGTREMEGAAVLEKIRQDSWGKNAEIILFADLSEVVKIPQTGTGKHTHYFVNTMWDANSIADEISRKLLSLTDKPTAGTV